MTPATNPQQPARMLEEGVGPIRDERPRPSRAQGEAALRLLRVAVGLLPPRFLQEYGAEILAVAREQAREAAALGRVATARFTLRAVADVLRTAVAERWRSSFVVAPQGGGGHQPRGEGSMHTLTQDLRHVLRGILRRPGYSLLVAGTLALGIGTSTAIFTVVHGVLLRPLQFADPDRLVRVHGRFDPESGFDFPQSPLSEPEYLDYRAAAKTMEDVAVLSGSGLTVTGLDSGPERVRGAVVSPNLLPLLRIEPVMGRAFTPEEGLPGSEEVVMLSHGYWRERFGGADVIGRRLTIDGRARTVVGVLPPQNLFQDRETRLWLPYVLDPANPGTRTGHGIAAIARLRPDATFEEAEAEMRQLMEVWKAEYPDIHTGHYLFLRPLLDDIVGTARRPLLTLLLASGLVLAIVCANVASIVLARGEERGREVAVRAALGASRKRLVSLLFLEGMGLALVGGALGLVVARLLVRALLALEAGSIPRSAEVAMHPVVVAFAVLCTVATAILFTLPPALHSTSTSTPQSRLGESTLRTTGSKRGVLFRQGLVAVEVALSFLLVLGAALLIRSLGELLRVDPGFERRGVLVAGLSLPESDYPEGEQVTAFSRELVRRARALPGVENAAVSDYVPMWSRSGVWDFELEGRVSQVDSEMAFNATFAGASEGYFETLGVPLVKGRVFGPQDTLDSQLVAVVNEEFVQRFLPNDDPLRQRIRVASSREYPWASIVGVVGNGRDQALDQEPAPVYYLVRDQTPRTLSGPLRFHAILLRTSSDPTTLVAPLRELLRELDPNLPLVTPQAMTEVVAETTAQQRFTTVVLAVFAGAALLLGASGIYGVLAFSVAQRRREIGIRTALGARPAQVLRLVATQGLLPVVIGLAAGGVASLLAGRALAGMLYGVTPNDPTTYTAVACGVIVVALLACWSPAARAVRADPTRTLRAD